MLDTPTLGAPEFEKFRRLAYDKFGLNLTEAKHELVAARLGKKLRELKTGGVELHLKLSSLPEIERWILGWGGDATVVKPPELRAAVRAAATRILNQAEEADTPPANSGKS